MNNVVRYSLFLAVSSMLGTVLGAGTTTAHDGICLPGQYFNPTDMKCESNPLIGLEKPLDTYRLFIPAD